MNLRKFVNKKIMIVTGICLIFLTIFYLISYSYYQSYEESKAEMETARENLQSTDLSGITISSYRLGDTIDSIPIRYYYGWFDCEDGNMHPAHYSSHSGSEPSDKKIGSIRLSSSQQAEYYLVEYNGVIVHDVTELIGLIGENYIEQKATPMYGYQSFGIFLDKENDIELQIGISPTWSTRHRLTLKRPGIISDDYNSPHQSSVYGGNPIAVTLFTLDRLSTVYFDSNFVPRKGQFTRSELATLPLLFTAMLIPPVALIVYRNRKAWLFFAYTTLALWVIHLGSAILRMH